MHRIIKLYLPLIVIIVTIMVLVFNYFNNMIFKPANVNNGNSVLFCLNPSQDIKEISKKLSESNLVSNKYIFKIIERFRGGHISNLDGCFDLSTNQSPYEIHHTLESRHYSEVEYELVAGKNVFELSFSLLESGIINSMQDFILDFHNQKIIEKFFINSINLEGYLIEGNYKIPRYASTQAIISIMLRKSNDIWDSNFREIVEKYNLDKKMILTIASILDKEVKTKKERIELTRKMLNKFKTGETISLMSPMSFSQILPAIKARLDYPESLIYKFAIFNHKNLPPHPIGTTSISSIAITIKELINSEDL